MTPEKRVQNKILEYLKVLKEVGAPIFYERRQAGGLSYKKGIPDIYAVYDGIHIEIEVKSPTGHTSTMQDKFAEMCRRNNIMYCCVSDVNEFIEYMQKIINA